MEKLVCCTRNLVFFVNLLMTWNMHFKTATVHMYMQIFKLHIVLKAPRKCFHSSDLAHHFTQMTTVRYMNV